MYNYSFGVGGGGWLRVMQKKIQPLTGTCIEKDDLKQTCIGELVYMFKIEPLIFEKKIKNKGE